MGKYYLIPLLLLLVISITFADTIDWKAEYNQTMSDVNDWSGVMHWNYGSSMYDDQNKFIESLLEMYTATNDTYYLTQADRLLTNVTTRESQWNGSSHFRIGHISGLMARFAHQTRYIGDAYLLNRSLYFESYVLNYSLPLIDSVYLEFEYNGETLGSLWEFGPNNKTNPLNQQYGYLVANAYLGRLGNTTRLDRAQKLAKTFIYATWLEDCDYGTGLKCRITPYRAKFNVSPENMTGAEYGIPNTHEPPNYWTQTAEAFIQIYRLGLYTNATFFQQIANTIYYNMFAQEGAYNNSLLWKDQGPIGNVFSDSHGYWGTFYYERVPYFSAYISNITNVSENILIYLRNYSLEGTSTYHNYYSGAYNNITNPKTGSSSEYATSEEFAPADHVKFMSGYILSENVDVLNLCTPYFNHSSWSAWVNTTSCAGGNATYQQNRSIVFYDINSCTDYLVYEEWGYQNLTCPVAQNLTSCDYIIQSYTKISNKLAIMAGLMVAVIALTLFAGLSFGNNPSVNIELKTVASFFIVLVIVAVVIVCGLYILGEVCI